MKHFFIILLSTIATFAYSQESFIDPDNVDYKFLYKEVLISLNKSRSENGKTNFSFSKSLNGAAILHTKQMNKYSFFSHENKKNSEFKTLLDRVLYLDGNYPFLAENIADIVLLNIEDNKSMSIKQENGKVVYTLKDGTPINYHSYKSLANKIVQTWMNSPGHRKNILNPDLSETGLGAVVHSGGEGIRKHYYVLITQTLGGL